MAAKGSGAHLPQASFIADQTAKSYCERVAFADSYQWRGPYVAQTPATFDGPALDAS